MSDPNFATEGSRAYDALFAGDFPRHEEEVTFASGLTLSRGAVVARADGGNFVLVDSGSADVGTQTARGVLAEDIDTTGGAEEATIYRTGAFAESEITFGGTDAVADHRDAAAEKGIFFRPVTGGV